MFERTVTVSSAAKMFNVTGWKIGWALGPAELITGVRAAKQYLTYVGGSPLQPGRPMSKHCWAMICCCSLAMAVFASAENGSTFR